MKKDKKCHFLKHLQSTIPYFDSYNSLLLKRIGKTNYKFHLKIEEASHVDWRKLN